MSCQHCKYFNENERWGSKGYCEYYKKYYYGTDSECSHFTKRDGGGGCFLTGACCDFRGLPDDCYELTVLRNFRDNYLKCTDSGASLVNEYYRIAPDIVNRINFSDSKKEAYEYIYSVVRKCVSLIESGENEAALNEYKEMVLSLKSKFLEGCF